MEVKPLLKADYFYDRKVRGWTLLWKDQNDNQQGEAEYFFGKDAKKRLLAAVKADQPSKIDLSSKIDPESFGKPVVIHLHKQY